MTPAEKMAQEIEEWRSIVGYEGFYDVSSNGRIRRLRKTMGSLDIPFETPLIKAQHFNGMYMRVGLYRNGKGVTKDVHRLVMEGFVGQCPDGKEVGHLDGNGKNNRLSNLAYITAKENQFHRKLHGTYHIGEKVHNAKFTNAQVRRIKALKGKISATKIAKELNVSPSTIQRIFKGDRWNSI